MDISEIRAAAHSAALKSPSEREDFVKESYRTATLEEIETIIRMADIFDERANEDYENNYFEPCKYNSGVHFKI